MGEETPESLAYGICAECSALPLVCCLEVEGIEFHLEDCGEH